MGGAQNLLQDLGPPGILVVVRADHDAVFAWLGECWKVKIRLGCCAPQLSGFSPCGRVQILDGEPPRRGGFGGGPYLETVSL